MAKRVRRRPPARKLRSPAPAELIAALAPRSAWPRRQQPEITDEDRRLLDRMLAGEQSPARQRRPDRKPTTLRQQMLAAILHRLYPGGVTDARTADVCRQVVAAWSAECRAHGVAEKDCPPPGWHGVNRALGRE